MNESDVVFKRILSLLLGILRSIGLIPTMYSFYQATLCELILRDDMSKFIGKIYQLHFFSFIISLVGVDVGSLIATY